MILTKLALKKKVTMLMVFIAITIFAIIALLKMPVSLMPNNEKTCVSIEVFYEETLPEIAESKVTSKIETAVNEIEGINDITSTSSTNYSKISCEIDKNYDYRYIKFQINEKVQNLQQKIPFATHFEISDYDVNDSDENDFFISLGISGPYQFDELENIIKRNFYLKIISNPNIAKAIINGYPEKQIKIIPKYDNKNSFTTYNLKKSLNKFGKQFSFVSKNENNNTVVILESNYDNYHELGNINIKLKNGKVTKLKDVAEIKLEYSEPKTIYRYNNKPQLVVNLYKKNRANILNLTNEIKTLINNPSNGLPDNVEVNIKYDESTAVTNEMNGLYKKALLTFVIIFLVLLFFMREFKSSFIVISSILFSLALTVILMAIFKIGLNIMSFAGITMGMGLIVDNSIVVYENIYRNRALKKSVFEAIYVGTNEVVLSLITSTITTLIVFVPFIFLESDLKEEYMPFVITTILAIISSLFISFTFIPFSLSHIYKKRNKNNITTNIKKFYTPILKWLIKLRWVYLIIIVILSYLTYQIYQNEIIKIDQTNYKKPKNLNVVIFSKNFNGKKFYDDIINDFEQKVIGDDKIKSFETEVHNSYATMEVVFHKNIGNYPLEVTNKLYKKAIQYGNVSIAIYGYGKPVTVNQEASSAENIIISGYNYEMTKKEALKFADYMRKFSLRFTNVKVDYDENHTNSKYYLIEIDNLKLMKNNVSMIQALSAINLKLNSYVNNFDIKIDGDDILVILENENLDIANIKDMNITNEVKFKQIASVTKKNLTPVISKKNGLYDINIVYTFMGDYEKKNEILLYFYNNYKFTLGVKFSKIGAAKKIDEYYETKKQLSYLIWAAIILVYMTLCGIFESFKYPFIIILTVPLALIGVIWIYYITEFEFGEYAKLGVILLAGIVVNDTIILLDRILSLRKKGMPLLDAVINGTNDRIRPILMTSLTTILGLVPMLIHNNSSNNGFWKLFSLSTIGGLISSTFFVITFTPTLFYLISDKAKKQNKSVHH